MSGKKPSRKPCLSDLQKRFVAEYLVDLNATAAYQRAGYKSRGHSAESASWLLLRNIEVQKAIAAAQHKSSERTEITQDYVLTRLKENVERSMQLETIRDKEGNPTGAFSYQGAVANGALKLLGEHLGMFTDKHEVTIHGGGNPIQYEIADLRKLPPAELVRLHRDSLGVQANGRGR